MRSAWNTARRSGIRESAQDRRTCSRCSRVMALKRLQSSPTQRSHDRRVPQGQQRRQLQLLGRPRGVDGGQDGVHGAELSRGWADRRHRGRRWRRSPPGRGAARGRLAFAETLTAAGAVTRRGTRPEPRSPRCRRPPPARSARPTPRPPPRAATAVRSPRPGGSRSAAPKPIRPWRARCTASGPAAEPVAGSSATPSAGPNIRVLTRASGTTAKQLTPTSPTAASAPRSGRTAATAASSSSATNACRGPVVVDLDRELGALQLRARPAAPPPARTAPRSGSAAPSRRGGPGRPRARVSRLTSPEPVTSPISSPPSRSPSTNAVPSTGCPANGQLGRRGEDPSAGGAAVFLAGQDEHRL